MTSRYWFRLLGPIEAWRDQEQVALGPPQQKAILALLLLHAGTPMSVAALADALWSTDPPKSAAMAVRSYIHRLRRALAAPALRDDQQSSADASGRLIETVGDSYVIRVSKTGYDLGVFRAELAAAQTARGAGDEAAADRHVRAALEQWQGRPLAGVPDTMAAPFRVGLESLHRTAVESRFTYELDRGDTGRAAAELAGLVAADPLDERFRELLMLALYRSGRQADALASYRDGRAVLADSLGVDPGPALEALHGRILAADPDLLLPRRAGSNPSAAEPVVPRQLPADLTVFSGRTSELADLHKLSSDAAGPRVVVVSGTAGVGKTALAIRWAHQRADSFPDGQLYLNLRGYDGRGRPVSASTAMRIALESLGVRPADMPRDLDARAARYRSLIAGRRLLIVADNVGSAGQVRALVPAGSGSMLVITSRDCLLGLVATHGACGLTVDPFSPAQARRLLADRLGDDRLRNEPEAAERITQRCAGLPLALAIVASRTAVRPSAALAQIADELNCSGEGLGVLALDDAGLDVREVMSWSYRRLTPAAARLFRLLALNPAPDNTAATAADLAGRSLPEVQRLLDELQQAHMIAERGRGRFASHDLLRAYALELAGAVDGQSETSTAIDRLYDGVAGRAHAAALTLAPREVPASAAPSAEQPPNPFGDAEAASSWFASERTGLLVLLQRASERNDPRTWRLMWAFDRFLDRNGRWSEQQSAQTIALASAQRQGDVEGQAYCHRALARASTNLGDHAGARHHITSAITLFGQQDASYALADTFRQSAWIAEQSGEYDVALQRARDGLALCEHAGLPAGVRAAALNAVGWYHALRGEFHHALRRCTAALVIFQQSSDVYGLADTKDSLGFVYHHLDDYSRAAGAYRNALKDYEALGVVFAQADTSNRLGDTLAASGSDTSAAKSWQHSAALFGQLQHPLEAEVTGKLVAAGRLL